MAFRVCLGIGGCISPLLGAIMYTAGGYVAIFMTIAALFLIFAPLIYYKLLTYKD